MPLLERTAYTKVCTNEYAKQDSLGFSPVSFYRSTAICLLYFGENRNFPSVDLIVDSFSCFEATTKQLNTSEGVIA